MDLCVKSTRASDSPFDCLLFDLDDTLYTSTTGIAENCRRNIEEFLERKCGFPAEKASSLRIELFKTYGSSLAGLRALGYDINADEYHSFVHGSLPYEAINPDLRLQNLLQSITQRKLIFTNSDRNHARKVLERLGIEDCFDQIICFESLNPNISKSKRPDEFPVVLKPSIEAMKIAVEIAGTDTRRTLFFDDNVRNIAAGKDLGLRTVLVGKAVKTKEADYLLESIGNLGQLIPEIWLGGEKKGDDKGMTRTRSEIESILETTSVGA
ncbi:haloacid dehalogenase-like hydrolase (HAD) superfamily protein [Tasmannia lanceolata]|uniref:haloacid dehalogenase-like hydrolase (HAD) superfamily protein n=1 Tax=Tasmannia lanceolata TaxID=3420 RepID=UPI0040627C52